MSSKRIKKRRNATLESSNIINSDDSDDAVRTKRLRSTASKENDSDLEHSRPLRNGAKQNTDLLSSGQNSKMSGNRPGKIVSIHLENFMCHSNLTINLEPRLNFIVGSNGCGKSAILTSLILGLGGNARITNRSNSIQKLIKSGENSAKIEISLANVGEMAYKKDIYGSKITVIRYIRQASSTYAIKSSSGNVVSRKLDDVRRILLNFNIRVDNPIFVLNQDSAREFLKDLQPNKNFELFMKASQLDIVSDTLSKCRNLLKEQINTIKFQNQIITEKKGEIEESKKKLQLVKTFEELKANLQKTELKLVWHEVKNLKHKLTEVKEEISVMEKQKLDYELKSKNKDDAHTQLTQQLSEYNQKRDNLAEQFQKQLNLLREAKKNQQSVNESEMELKMQLKNIERLTDQYRQNFVEIKEHIEKYDSGKEKIEHLRNKNNAEIKELRTTKKELNDFIENLRRDLEIFQNNKAEKMDQFNINIEKQNTALAKINVIKAEISALETNSQNKLSVFGAEFVAFVNDIQMHYKAGRFIELPRGPIGQYIEVPNAKYRDLVENQLSSYLRSFIVSNDKDRATLNELLQKRNIRPTIIKTTFMNKVYDVSAGAVKPPPNTRLLMDEIICNDPIVMNLLIDLVGIENVLITESKETAEYYTSDINNKPKNLTRILVPNLGLEYFAAPMYSMYSFSFKKAQFLQVNAEERFNLLHIELSEAHNTYEDFKKAGDSLNKAIIEIDRDLKNKPQLYEAQRQQLREVEKRLYELENYEYPPENQIDVLKEELAQLEAVLKKHEATMASKLSELESLRPTIITANEEVEKNQKLLRDLEAEQNKSESEAEQLKLKMRYFDIDMKKIEKDLKAVVNSITLKERECKKLIEEIDNETAKALRQGDYIESDESLEDLQDDIRKYKALIKERSKDRIDVDAVKNDIEIKQKELLEAQEKDEMLKHSNKVLYDAWKTRLDMLSRLHSHIFSFVDYSFSKLMNLRSYRGELKSDLKKGTISIEACRINNGQSDDIKNVNSLSGGERSFTTICFLKALWTCSDHPFYFLDEYDVFTDELNRKIITDLLIMEASDNPFRQYALLTPQDTQVEKRDFITIHKLSVPQRSIANK